jgi:hypothetical protein
METDEQIDYKILNQAYQMALRTIVTRDKRIKELEEERDATWRIMLREIGLPDDSPDPAMAIIRYIDRLHEDRIKLARSC